MTFSKNVEIFPKFFKSHMKSLTSLIYPLKGKKWKILSKRDVFLKMTKLDMIAYRPNVKVFICDIKSFGQRGAQNRF